MVNIAPHSGIFSFTFAAYFTLLTRWRSLGDKTFDQIGQIDEIHDPKERTAFPECNLEINRSAIGPLRRNCANRSLAELQQKPFTDARIALAKEEELPSSIRMERVRDPHKICGYRGRTCTLG